MRGCFENLEMFSGLSGNKIKRVEEIKREKTREEENLRGEACDFII